MNKFLSGILLMCVLVNCVLTSLLATEIKETSARYVIKIGKKFGQFSSKKATIDPIVHLANPDNKPFCTAFVVDKNYAITAAHCIDQSLPYYKFLNSDGDDTGTKATVVGFDNRSDLAVLHGDFNNFKNLKVNFHDANFFKGEDFVACGYPYGQHGLSCNTFSPVDNVFFTIRGKANLVPGMSGGPVINVRTGEAIGVNFAVVEGFSLINPVQGLLGLFELN